LNQIQTKETKYDLGERTAKFGEDIIKFLKKINQDSITRPLISQLIRSSTSIGANYCEADNASSRKEFFHRIGISRKETKETQHWLRMIKVAVDRHYDEIEHFECEVLELNKIFSSIIHKERINSEG